MKRSLYKKLRGRIIFLILLVSFTPLLLLGATIYYKFALMYRQKIEEQITYRSASQAEAVDLFLKERTAVLTAMADTHRFADLIESDKLARILEIMNLRAGAFVDLGVIDDQGLHRAYVGPFQLKGLNYYDQPWFGEVMGKGLYISDVFMGYRRLPHFIIAVRRQENHQSWILRATIDPDVLRNIVQPAKTGKTGDAYLVNRAGVFQMRPRFFGEILWESNLDTSLFGARTTVLEQTDRHGRNLLYAGSWLQNKNWLLVVSQESGEEMADLFAARNVEIAIVAAGLLAIVLTAVFTTGVMVRHLAAADERTNELNAQLMQSDKLAALGRMATGIAHEINNPLAVIAEKAGWMRDLLCDENFQGSDNLQEYIKSIEKIEEHVERARKITHNMLGFARRMEPRQDDVDVNAVLSQTVDLLKNHARINNIAISTDYHPGLPVIASDQSQLQQVFLNLINNAIDAIGSDGQIRVKTGINNGAIGIDITDDGPGIPPEQQRRIFDPFFTTKPTGKGTGLGLSISYAIIEKLGGRITFKSMPSLGATFSVFLPVIVPEKK